MICVLLYSHYSLGKSLHISSNKVIEGLKRLMNLGMVT
jgi:hypothetical protein